MAKFHFLVVCSLLAVLSHSNIGNAADPCDQDPCQNTGTCTSGTNFTEINLSGSPSTGYQCTCLNGYTGPNCEIDPCANAPCQNGGICQVRTANDEGYSCRCKNNFLERNCERDTNACRSDPCLNGGECRNRPATGSFMCRCFPGTSGDLCENNVDDCASSPCQNTATCMDRVGGFECICPKGIVGKVCEIDFRSLIEVICDARVMTIKLVQSLLPDLDDPSSIHLDDETCTGVLQDDSKIMLSTPYGECGTTVAESESGDTIIFSNTVLHTKNVITTHDLLQLPVQCILGKKEIVHGPLYRIALPLITPMRGYAQFELMLERYSDCTFVAPPSSVDVDIGDKLCYAVTLDFTPDLTVLLDDCWTTPREDANDTLRYDLIMDGCKIDRSVEMYPTYQLGSLKQGFSFQAFAFVGEYPEVHVHCAVTVCVTGHSGCQQRCNASPPRLRRSIRDVPSLMSNTITSEPITIRPQL